MNQIYRGINPYDNFQFDSTKIDYQGWGSDHPILSVLIEIIKPKLILEVGSWKGLSAIYMAKAVKKMGLTTEIVCIDTWLGSPEHWLPNQESNFFQSLNIESGYPTLYKTFVNNVIGQDCQSIITPFPLDSYSAFTVLNTLGIKADIVYIDAGHEYQSVFRDINNYWSILSVNGSIVMDDFNSWPGVTKAVLEFCSNHTIVPLLDNRKAVICKSQAPSLSNFIHYNP